MTKSEDGHQELFEDHTPIPEHLLRVWTERLREGEQSELAGGWARFILYDFCARTRLKQPQSQHTLDWLADRLGRMLAHEYKRDARECLSLPSRREGASATVDEAINIACWVKLAMDRGYLEPDAIKQAAAVFQHDEKHIRRQRKRALDWTEAMNPNRDWDDYFEQRRRPLPKRKQART